jgi:transcriptional regulator with XRE-family HTH domain
VSSESSIAAKLLGERVRAHREALGISQQDAANLANIDVSNFGKIERGKANPNLHTIIRIATVLGVDPGLLMHGLSGQMVPESNRRLTAREFMRARSL